MSNVHLGQKSLALLETVKPELKKVILKACETMPFDITILEGIRSYDRQLQLYKEGASKTLKSKHLTGDAIDIAPWPINWKDIERFNTMAEVVLNAAKELDVHVVWGGNWSEKPHDPKGKFQDCPHFQLGH